MEFLPCHRGRDEVNSPCRRAAFRKVAVLSAFVAFVAAADEVAQGETAADAEAAPEDCAVALDATATFDVTSGYLLYGALMNSQPCAQGGIEAGATCGGWGRFGVGAWSNSDLTGRRTTFGKAFNENDFYLHYGRAFEIADEVSLNLRAMHMWYWYPHSTGHTGKGCPSKRELYLIGSVENPYVTPYCMWTHEWELTDGTYFECGLRRRCAITEGFSLTPSFSGNWLSHGYMTIFPAPAGERSCEAGIGCLRVSLLAEYAVTAQFSIHARLDGVSLVNDDLRGAVREAKSPYMNDFAWGEVGCSYSF